MGRRAQRIAVGVAAAVALIVWLLIPATADDDNGCVTVAARCYR